MKILNLYAGVGGRGSFWVGFLVGALVITIGSLIWWRLFIYAEWGDNESPTKPKKL